MHRSTWYARVPLSLVDINVGDVENGRAIPEWAEVNVRQHYREVSPRIWLGRSESSDGWDLTAGEARMIADQLAKAADLAEGSQGGDA
jgi:hypothetical protein